ncbi:MAG TPA: AraC family transcriptional regulator [Candidatus Dormibacteraeota bacterium]|jgi:AraC-like DNA-binding protein|nr:AraC family transcriptional regulator [Candidatus Dormibacteraeota bacterium]
MSVEHRPGTPSPRVARRLLRAKDFIDLHYDEPLRVDVVAHAAHHSPAHFARQFHRAFGETPHQYLLSRRLERAAHLLRNTDYTFARIAVTVGMSGVGTFTSAFRRVYGQTPTEYRAEHLPGLVDRVIPSCVREAINRPRLSRI